MQPAASMKLLVAQIKETMVKKIPPQGIWYVHMYDALCSHTYLAHIYSQIFFWILIYICLHYYSIHCGIVTGLFL